jgi:hypothetical protein
VSQMDPYQRGRRDGIRWAVTWLHSRAKEMSDPKARSVLETVAYNMGTEASPKVAQKRDALQKSLTKT